VNSSCPIVGDATGARWRPVLEDATSESSQGVVTGRLRIPRNLAGIAGHFPALPIVPGVVQLGWVAELVRTHGIETGPFSGIVSVKFRRILQPGVDLRVRLESGRSAGEVQFEFKRGDFVVSCGRLLFGDRC
jgi:3-hydroxymyristoyl/3-hydroxydecanoyl-(acyl carrier protein) dehydratase